MTQKERSRDKCHNMCVCFVCNMLKMIVPIPCVFTVHAATSCVCFSESVCTTVYILFLLEFGIFSM